MTLALHFLCATAYELDPHRGGMAGFPDDHLYRRDRQGHAILALDVPWFVCDGWCTSDRTLVDDERPGWDVGEDGAH